MALKGNMMSTKTVASVNQDKSEALSSAAIARRRMLLKGLGKGGAALAGTVSIQSLASATNLVTQGGNKCSISGQHSAVHSQSTSTQTCGGHKIVTYKDHTTWPKTVNKNADHHTVCKDSQRKAYGEEDFVSGDDDDKEEDHHDGSNWTYYGRGKVRHCHPNSWKSDTSKRYSKTEVTCTLKDIIDFHGDNNEDEAHWVCAWLNAHKFPQTYPYTPVEIKAFYDCGSGTEKYNNALAFCKTLETS